MTSKVVIQCLDRLERMEQRVDAREGEAQK